MKILYDLRRYKKYEIRGIKRIIFLIDSLILNTGFQVTLLYRISNYLYKKKIPFFHRLINAISRVLMSDDISYEAEIGPGLMIIHGFGIVIGANVTLGKNAYLLNNITIGSRNPGGNQPKIGDNVYIGVGARILGDITIGDNVKIGANTVVLNDVPSNCTVVGNPGRVVKVD